MRHLAYHMAFSIISFSFSPPSHCLTQHRIRYAYSRHGQEYESGESVAGHGFPLFLLLINSDVRLKASSPTERIASMMISFSACSMGASSVSDEFSGLGRAGSRKFQALKPNTTPLIHT